MSFWTQSEFSLSKGKCFIKTRLRQAHKNRKSQIKWQWTPHSTNMTDLLKNAFAQQICRISWSLIWMLLCYQWAIFRVYLWQFLALDQKLHLKQALSLTFSQSSKSQLWCTPLWYLNQEHIVLLKHFRPYSKKAQTVKWCTLYSVYIEVVCAASLKL